MENGISCNEIARLQETIGQVFGFRCNSLIFLHISKAHKTVQTIPDANERNLQKGLWILVESRALHSYGVKEKIPVNPR